MVIIRGACTLAAVLALTGVASAQGVGSDRMARFSEQLDLLDNRAAQQYGFSDRLRPESPAVTAIPRYDGAYSGPWLAVARAAARRHGIPEDLFLRLVQQESGWDTGALSHAGAIGLAQLMPDTAARLGVDPHDAHDNLDAGARYPRAAIPPLRRLAPCPCRLQCGARGGDRP